MDMDAFFASVEQRDEPALRGLPVIVGGLCSLCVVSTASYEARQFGVHSAMSMAEARRRCPGGIFLPCDHEKYSAVSHRIMNILAAFSPLVEPLSLDEAFLDMTGMEGLYPDLIRPASLIKERIKNELNLTASVGVAPNKFLAKLASDLKKPDGLVLIRHGEEAAVLKDMPVSRLWGVGETTARILHKLGITTIGQVAAADVLMLEKYCGKLAYEIKELAMGHDRRPVEPWREPKSIGRETTFETDLIAPAQIRDELLKLAERVGWRLRRQGYSARTLTVKIRFASFRTITRSCSLDEPTNFDEMIYQTVCRICDKVTLTEGIRLLGITAANLQAGGGQVSLFGDTAEKKRSLYQTVDKLKEKFGEGIITRGNTPGY